VNHSPYPKYKNSGIGWIGDVPDGWRIDRIKASIKSCNNGIWGAEPDGDHNDTICVRVADFDRDNLSVEENDENYEKICDFESKEKKDC
jgi:type I restriction enzyme S subunit